MRPVVTPSDNITKTRRLDKIGLKVVPEVFDLITEEPAAVLAVL